MKFDWKRKTFGVPAVAGKPYDHQETLFPWATIPLELDFTTAEILEMLHWHVRDHC